MYQFQGQQPFHNNASGAPPAKRQKSNAVVTHYPPPPGYVPPPNAQLPQSWQAAGYPAAQYGAAQYPQQQYGQQYPQQAYNQQYGAQQYPQQQQYPGYPQAMYQGYPGYPGYQQPNAWPQQQQQPYAYSQQPQYPAAGQQQAGLPHPQPTPATPYSATSQNVTPSSEAPRHAQQSSVSEFNPDYPNGDDGVQVAKHEFDEADYSREASFAKEADHVQAELSLGIIVYYPARPVKTALPATFEEAQAQMIDTKARDGEDESVSRFFNKAQIANTESSIRNSDEWASVKEDVIVRDFPRRTDSAYTPITKVIEDRQRPGPSVPDTSVEATTEAREARSASPLATKLAGSDALSNAEDEDGEAMDTDSDDDEVAVSTKPDETAADATEASAKPAATPPSSTSSNNGAKMPPGPWNSDMNVHRQPQNGPNGVSQPRKSLDSGAPKGPRRESSGIREWQTPGRGRPQPQNQHQNGPHSNKKRFSQHKTQYGPHNPPPPPGMPGHWSNGNGHRSGSPASVGSGHTEAGGDFEMDDDDLNKTPHGAKQDHQPGSGRKRGFDEVEPTDEGIRGGHQPHHPRGGHRNGGDRRRQADDTTPRMRRGRPRVPDAYSRRYR